MANSAQATNPARQPEKQRQHSASQRAAMRTTVKKVLAAIEAGDKEAANVAFRSAQSSLDAMTIKGVVSKNKASRTKSRVNARIKAMA